jgi:ABC-type phosphate/phosphonate transport system substrate-binding protein
MPARLHKRTYQLLTLVAALTVVTPAIAKDALTLNFGVFSNANPTAVVRTYMPALKELESSMSAMLDRTVDIRMHISKDQAQGVAYLNQGTVDFASLSNANYLKSKTSNPQIRILAARNAMDSTTLTPWVAKAGMHDSVFMALRESLFNLRNSKALTSLRAFGFVQSDDSQYAHLKTSLKRASSIAYSNYLNGKKIPRTILSNSEPALLSAMKAEEFTNYTPRIMADETYQILLKKPYE